MKFVVDTNIIISSIIKDSLSRKIIFNKNFEFITPSYTLSEINKHRLELCKKSGLSSNELNKLLEKLFNYIKIVNYEIYKDYLEKSKKLIDDVDDISFLACAMALKSNIWSNDSHFKNQKIVKIFTTKEFIKKFLKKTISL